MFNMGTNRPQTVWIGGHSGAQHRSPPGLCAQPPPVLKAVVKVADDASVTGEIPNNDETSCQKGNQQSCTEWRTENNLLLNVDCRLCEKGGKDVHICLRRWS